ncbi:MAG TPA: dTMP kinase [Acidimicrobiales bacterium]|nr:dTMP kinase [Acidimicrobiales bacterium]
MSRGLFVVFEGIDGCGKTTQARRVAAARGAQYAFEPGDSPLGVDLRRWVLDAATPMTPATEALLMLADRSYHVTHVIAPRLEQGGAVVCDRYAASTLAFQGYGRGVDLGDLHAATALAIGDCQPDLTVLIDVSVEVAHEREARDLGDRFEASDAAFHERVRRGYLELAATSRDWVVIDGEGDMDSVAVAVDDVLDALAWPGA